MSWRDYLLDRLPLLLAFTLALLFLLLVIQLGFMPLALGDVAYILLLGASFAGLILAVDYYRQRTFRQAVERQLEPGAGKATLPPGKTREQRAYARVLQQVERNHADELRRYRKQAEEHRAFVDLWVHQMKTPLSVLELTAQQAEAGADVWNSVGEELDRLAHGLELMLSTARLERFDLDLHLAALDLTALCRSVINNLQRSWIRAGIYPRVSAPEEPVLIESDAKWLALVLGQLLTNAIKYSHAGQEVLVSIQAGADGVLLAVHDSGIGIPPEDMKRIFERFYTGLNGRRGQASTGMGLYLAAEICGRLGHALEASSAAGSGTTFSISFSSRSLHRLGNPQPRQVTPL